MLDLNKHKLFIVQILKDIYSDIELGNSLGFKGGTALMLFYGLPRFSVDLDFNLINEKKADTVYNKVRSIIRKYGKIKDEARKHFGIIIVLDYGQTERNLKVEISTRVVSDSYETKNFLGINVRVMRISDMFAHKLCALLDRNVLVNRDIFDCYFLMQQRTPVNKAIVEQRMKVDFSTYLEKCIVAIENVNEKRILSGLGDLMDEETKKFVKNKLKSEVVSLLKFYQKYPPII